jgi:hypothetical protein
MTMIGYIGLVYAFLGDMFVFGYNFSLLQYGIVLVLLAVNLAVMISNK